MKRPAHLFSLITLISSSLFSAHAHADDTPKVYELFTSQGCSSCPPADNVAATYADDPNILVLSYHVDYWNYIGWKDPYSSKESTQRQRHYAAAWNTRRIYTPQAIIQGEHDIVGSNGSKIRKTLANVTTPDWVDISLKRSGNILHYTLPESTVRNGEIWLVTYDKKTENNVTRGENHGRHLSHRNSVTHISPVASWNGEKTSHTLSLPNGSDGVALLLQAPNYGKMLGAGWL